MAASAPILMSTLIRAQQHNTTTITYNTCFDYVTVGVPIEPNNGGINPEDPANPGQEDQAVIRETVPQPPDKKVEGIFWDVKDSMKYFVVCEARLQVIL
jgi:hypothetical protein